MLSSIGHQQIQSLPKLPCNALLPKPQEKCMMTFLKQFEYYTSYFTVAHPPPTFSGQSFFLLKVKHNL